MTTEQRLDSIEALLQSIAESNARTSNNIDRLVTTTEQLVATTRLLEQASANALNGIIESRAEVDDKLEQLVMTTQLLEQAVANVFNGMTELRADINVDLKAELIEIKETAKIQAAIADKQAESVRALIQMLNQRQA